MTEAGLETLDSKLSVSDSSAKRDFLFYRQTGELAALERALRAAKPELLEHAYSLTRHRADAADLVQETLLIAAMRHEQFRCEAEFSAWLRGILRNLTRKHRARRGPRPLSLHAPSGPQQAEPLQSALNHELRQCLSAAIARLSPRYREVLELYLAGETTSLGIAEKLGRSASTVRSQLERGLRKLRRHLPKSLAPLVVALLVGGPARASLPPRRPHARLLPVFGGLALLILLTGLRLALWPRGPRAEPAFASDRSPLSSTSREVDAQANKDSLPRSERRANEQAGVTVALSWPDGRPAAGVALVLETDARPGTQPLLTHFDTWRHSITDTEGEAHFLNLPSGATRLRLDDVSVLHRLELRPGQRHRIEKRVETTFEIAGTVRNGLGLPVAGAEIWISGSRRMMTPGYIACRSDELGRFAAPLFLARIDFELWAAAAGIGVSNCYRPQAARLRLEQDLVVRSSARRIEGLLLGPQGSGVAGIVALYPKRSAEYAPPIQYAQTDSRGRFTFEHLTATGYRLAGTAPGLAGSTVELDLSENERRNLLLQLTQGVLISGQVHGFELQQLQRLRVGGRSPASLLRAPEQFLLLRSAAVAADASFRVGPFPPGATLLGVMDIERPHGPLDSLLLEIPAAGALRCDFFAQARAPWRVRVQTPSGAPAAKLWVALAHPTQKPSDGRYTALASTDAEGLAEFATLPQHPLQVFVLSEPTARLPLAFARDVMPGSKLVLVLPQQLEAGRVSGTLTQAPADFRTGVSLRLRHEGSSAARLLEVAASERRFSFQKIPPGNYVLELIGQSSPRAAVALAKAVVTSASAIDLGELRVPEWGVLRVRAPRNSADSVLPFSVRQSDGSLLLAAQLLGSQLQELKLPTVALRLEFLDTAGILRSHQLILSRDERRELMLDTGAGHPVRLLFPFSETQGKSTVSGSAVVTIRSQKTVSDRHFSAVYLDGGLYSVSTDLAPGAFQISFISTWNRPLQRTIEVLERHELQEFRLPLVRL